MAVVTGKSDLIADSFAGDTGANPEQARGRPIVAAGTAANASTDSAGSKYHLADLPADCILDVRTAFKVDGWGFATVSIGTKDDIDALVSVAKSAGATVAPVTLGAAAFHGKPLWQALGLAARPANNMIAIYAHGPANATGAGTMPFEIHYRYR